MANSSKNSTRMAPERKPESSRAAVPSIMEIAARLGRRIPPKERNAIPGDLSSQLDHCVYGTPKR